MSEKRAFDLDQNFEDLLEHRRRVRSGIATIFSGLVVLACDGLAVHEGWIDNGVAAAGLAVSGAVIGISGVYKYAVNKRAINNLEDEFESYASRVNVQDLLRQATTPSDK